MVVSMQFDEREEEDADGEANTVCFNKKERFKCTDAFFGNTLWEMVQNFGYATREDGKIEVYHYGQKWQGPFFIRLIFQMHARYVIWATEQHVNSPRFLAQDEDEDDLVAQRHNIPKHLLGQFLDGLDVDVQAKLNTTLAALQQARSSEQEEEVKELLGTVQRLEGLVAELQAAKLRRAKTMVEAPLQRRVTEGGPSQKMGGSARGLYQRALVRRATAVEEDDEDELQRQTTDLSSTIEAALEKAEEVVTPVRTAIVRRLTAIEDSMKEEEDEVVSVPLKRHSTLNRRMITSIVNSEEDAAAPELMEAAREIEVEAAPEVAVVVEAPAPEVVV